mgnify:CR=1 FL=1
MPSDVSESARAIWRSTADRFSNDGWVRPNKRIFNNAQISDHFAIIPTTTGPKHLDEMEGRVYDMIARRFVATFFPAAEFNVTTRISTVAPGHDFKTEGKVLTAPGWLAVYGKTTVDDSADAKALPALIAEDNAQAKTISAELHAETTKPPPRYTEATLLSAMEGAGKLVDDESMAEAMKERGLGTPATRADTIDGLINQKYLERNQRELVPTTKAESLLQFLAAVHADALTKPDMTGEWEYKLRQMEHGKFPRRAFMSEIVEVTKGIVERTKNFEEDDSNSRVTDIISPTRRQADGRYSARLQIAGRRPHDLQGDERPQNRGRRSPRARDERRDRSARWIRLRENRQPFSLEIKNRGRREKSRLEEKPSSISATRSDVNTLVPFWTDPKTGAELCEAPTSYVLRERDGDGWKEIFKVGRLMCQKEVTREQAIQLVERGKTDLIEEIHFEKRPAV